MGLVTARILLARGACVAVCDISADDLEQLHTSLPTDQSSHCFVQTESVTDESAVEAFLTKTKAFWETERCCHRCWGSGSRIRNRAHLANEPGRISFDHGRQC